MPRTRLDAVLNLRVREEERAAQALALAESKVRATEARRDEVRERLRGDARVRGEASHWELQELARHRALAEQQRVENELHRARAAAAQERASFAVAHQRAEVIRRVAESRRQEALREAQRLDDRALDEVAALRFVHRMP